jgi:hypothetical protein
MPLKDILPNYKAPRYDPRFDTYYFESRYFVKASPAIEFSEKKLDLDPYTLGVWLGDGHSAGQRITTADPEIFNYIPLKADKNKHKYNYGLAGITSYLRRMDLINNKHIPDDYLFGSIAQRTALLQGLIDTDGHVPNRQTCIDFSNKNYRLIKDVQHLVRSLGGRAHLRQIKTSCNGKNFDSYRLFIWFDKSIMPCKLKRKVARFRPFKEINNRIRNITFCKTGLGRCISVDNEDGTYITDDFIRTHNSTILLLFKPFHAVVFQERRFIVIVSNTFKKAAMSLDTIKKELVENTLLNRHFPGMEVVKDAEGDSIIRHPTGFETKILCKGVDQIGSIRGVKFGAYRPDLIIGDDMEDDELVRSPERRLQLQTEFDEALVPAGEKGLCQYIMVGTILHDDSLLSKLVSKDFYPEYKKLFYKAHIKPDTPEEESLWPEQWTIEWLKNLRKNNPRVYAKEYQNDPVAAGTEKFKREDFRYWKLENGNYYLFDRNNEPVGVGALSDCKAAIACDLAWKEKRENDSSVIFPGFLTPQSDILFLTYITKKGMKPDEVGEQLFLLEERLRKLTGSSVPIGFEKAMLENVTQWLLKQAMKKRNHFLVTKELVWDADKNTRIETRLQPRYAQHVIYHMRDMGELEHQLERFPYGTHDDLIDAAQGLVQLLQYPKRAKGVPQEEDKLDYLMRKLVFEKQEKPKSYTSSKNSGARVPYKDALW